MSETAETASHLSLLSTAGDANEDQGNRESPAGCTAASARGPDGVRREDQILAQGSRLDARADKPAQQACAVDHLEGRARDHLPDLRQYPQACFRIRYG